MQRRSRPASRRATRAGTTRADGPSTSAAAQRPDLPHALGNRAFGDLLDAGAVVPGTRGAQHRVASGTDAPSARTGVEPVVLRSVESPGASHAGPGVRATRMGDTTPIPVTSSPRVIRRLLESPWNNLPTLYKSAAQTRLIPDDVKDALSAYFAVADGANRDTLRDRLNAILVATNAWAIWTRTAFPTRVVVSDVRDISVPTSPADQDWAMRLSTNLYVEVRDELDRLGERRELRSPRAPTIGAGRAEERSGLESVDARSPSLGERAGGSAKPQPGFGSADEAFKSLGVDATKFTPANEQASELLGEASANPTYKITYTFPGSEKKAPYLGYFKAEKSKLDQKERGAVNFGVPENDPRLSARSVATYALAKELGMSEIPHTDYAVHKIDGRFHAGSIMESAGEGATTIQGAAKLDADAKAAIRASLSRLQMFDLITGQTDRHQGNILVPKGGGAVRGIDNDLAFGGVDSVTNSEVFGKVNTLSPADLVADKQFATDLKKLLGDKGRLEALKEVVTQHLDAPAANAMVTRLASLVSMLESRSLVDDWAASKAKYKLAIGAGESFAAPF